MSYISGNICINLSMNVRLYSIYITDYGYFRRKIAYLRIKFVNKIGNFKRISRISLTKNTIYPITMPILIKKKYLYLNKKTLTLLKVTLTENWLKKQDIWLENKLPHELVLVRSWNKILTWSYIEDLSTSMWS